MRPAQRIRLGLNPGADPLAKLGTARRTPLQLADNPNDGKRHAASLGHANRTFAHLPLDPSAFPAKDDCESVTFPRRDAIGRKRAGTRNFA